MSKFISFLMGAVATALIFVNSADAQTNRRVNEKVVSLSPDEAAQRWSQFSSNKIACDYCMAFSITHAPRKSAETFFDGFIFGAVRNNTVMTRVLVKSRENKKFVADFILLNSPKGSRVFSMDEGKFKELPPDKWETPMLDGLIYSPFDILTPYRHWLAAYDGVGRIGQAVHFYKLTNPDSAKNGTVKIALSREFNSPISVERLSDDGTKMRTLSLGAVRKIDGLWIMLEASLRNDASRDRDILKFTAVKLRLNLAEELFSPISAETPEIPLLEKI